MLRLFNLRKPKNSLIIEISEEGGLSLELPTRKGLFGVEKISYIIQNNTAVTLEFSAVCVLCRLGCLIRCLIPSGFDIGVAVEYRGRRCAYTAERGDIADATIRGREGRVELRGGIFYDDTFI